MGINPLDPGSASARPDRDVRRGHGTRALGPSDSSDSGSDVAGGAPGESAGADVGDVNLDSDSDRNGTGERAAAGPDEEVGDGADIDTDRIDTLPPDIDPHAEDDDEA